MKPTVIETVSVWDCVWDNESHTSTLCTSNKWVSMSAWA
jgi:hypothetical protein